MFVKILHYVLRYLSALVTFKLLSFQMYGYIVICYFSLCAINMLPQCMLDVQFDVHIELLCCPIWCAHWMSLFTNYLVILSQIESHNLAYTKDIPNVVTKCTFWISLFVFLVEWSPNTLELVQVFWLACTCFLNEPRYAAFYNAFYIFLTIFGLMDRPI